MRTVIPVSIDTIADRDILDWLNQCDNRSAVVREALRAYRNQGAITLADVYHAVMDLKRAGIVVSDNPQPATTEPDDIADTLDNLGA